MSKLMKWVLAAILICGNMVLTSCSKKDEPEARDNEYTGIPIVILDTDIGSSADDLFALEMLCRYDEQQLCKLLGVVVDREGEANADFTDAMNTYFGHQDVPIGLVRDGIKNPKVWIDYAYVAYMTEADGSTPMFPRTINQSGVHTPNCIQQYDFTALIPEIKNCDTMLPLAPVHWDQLPAILHKRQHYVAFHKRSTSRCQLLLPL